MGTFNTAPWQADKAAPGALYEAVFSILGTSATLFPILGLDGSAGGSALKTATTYTTMPATSTGPEAVVTNRVSGSATALQSWGTSPSRVGVCPIATFNGTTEDMDTPDIVYFTRSSAAWSVGIWVKPRVVNAAMSLVSKYANTTGATQLEWDCGMTADGYPYINGWDDSVPAKQGRLDATPLTAGSWQFLGFSDDGSNTNGGNSVYLNGASVDDTNDSSGVFSSMEDKTSLVRIGARLGASALEQFYDGAIAGGPCGPFFVQAELTAAQWKRLFLLGRVALELT